jgi:hypothetical protein
LARWGSRTCAAASLVGVRVSGLAPEENRGYRANLSVQMIRKLFCGISDEEIITLITVILDENVRAWAGRVELSSTLEGYRPFDYRCLTVQINCIKTSLCIYIYNNNK